MVTLFTVLGIGMVLFFCLNLVRSQNVCTMRSQTWNACLPIVEAGIEDAMAHLNNPLDTNITSDGWALVNGTYQQQRQLGNCFYSVNITMTNAMQPVIISTGYVPLPLVGPSTPAGPGFPSSQVLSNQYMSRTAQAIAQRSMRFVRAMVAKEAVNMNGNSISTDSFDSRDTNYSNLGHYDPTKRKDNGDVATVSGLTNIIGVGNANINGRLRTGPTGSATVGSNGKVGSLAWNASANTGIQPGWFFNDMNVSFPDVTRPFTGPGLTPGSGKIANTNYTYVLGSTNYELASLNLSSGQKVGVVGNATLLVDGDLNVAGNGASIDIILPGSLKLYVGGVNGKIGGGGVNNFGWATNFIYYGMPTNTQLIMQGNGQFTGSIYAPSAALSMIGGGVSVQDFSGACVVRSITVNGHYNFHYDEALGKSGVPSIYIVTSWLEL
jgi:hypothetical protein